MIFHHRNSAINITSKLTAFVQYYNNRVNVCGHKYVLGPAQNEPEKGLEHIYAQEHKFYYY